MTPDDVAKLLTMIAARYPTAKLWDQEAALTAQVWHMSLDDVPYPAAEKALVEWFHEEKWPPDPSELRDRAFGLIMNCRSAEEREALEPGWMAANARWLPENRGLRAVG